MKTILSTLLLAACLGHPTVAENAAMRRDRPPRREDHRVVRAMSPRVLALLLLTGCGSATIETVRGDASQDPDAAPTSPEAGPGALEGGTAHEAALDAPAGRGEAGRSQDGAPLLDASRDGSPGEDARADAPGPSDASREDARDARSILGKDGEPEPDAGVCPPGWTYAGGSCGQPPTCAENPGGCGVFANAYGDSPDCLCAPGCTCDLTYPTNGLCVSCP